MDDINSASEVMAPEQEPQLSTRNEKQLHAENSIMESIKRCGGRKLWFPLREYMNFELMDGDDEMIMQETLRKAANPKRHKPAIRADASMARYFKERSFDSADRMEIGQYIESLSCSRLREQSYYLLKYVRNEMKSISDLMEEMGDPSQAGDADRRMCLEELVKMKKRNILYIESIRNSISHLICTAEDSLEHLRKYKENEARGNAPPE